MYSSTAEQKRRAEVQKLATELYSERREYLLRIAKANATNWTDAEEAVSEAFASFLRAFDPDSDAPPLAWLTLSLKRDCWAKRRKSLKQCSRQEVAPESGQPDFVVDSIDADVPEPGEQLERAEWLVEARRRLTQLKPAERRALVLIGAGYSYSEVGEITGFSYTKINRCAAEGRSALRRG